MSQSVTSSLPSPAHDACTPQSSGVGGFDLSAESTPVVLSGVSSTTRRRDNTVLGDTLRRDLSELAAIAGEALWSDPDPTGVATASDEHAGGGKRRGQGRDEEQHADKIARLETELARLRNENQRWQQVPMKCDMLQYASGGGEGERYRTCDCAYVHGSPS